MFSLGCRPVALSRKTPKPKRRCPALSGEQGIADKQTQFAFKTFD
jgi:hypothetical protein